MDIKQAFIPILKASNNKAFTQLFKTEFNPNATIIDSGYLIARYFLDPKDKHKFEILLENGLNIFLKDIESSIFVTLASFNDLIELLELALEKIDTINDDKEILDALVGCINVENIEGAMLILKKTNSNTILKLNNEKKQNILHLTILKRNLKLFQLISNYAPQLSYFEEKNKISPIGLCILTGQYSMLKYLDLIGIDLLKEQNFFKYLFINKGKSILDFVDDNFIIHENPSNDINSYVRNVVKLPIIFNSITITEITDSYNTSVYKIYREVIENQPGILELFLSRKLYKQKNEFYNSKLSNYYQIYDILFGYIEIEELVLEILNLLSFYKSFLKQFEMELLSKNIESTNLPDKITMKTKLIEYYSLSSFLLQNTTK